jgi:hypothetical protein
MDIVKAYKTRANILTELNNSWLKIEHHYKPHLMTKVGRFKITVDGQTFNLASSSIDALYCLSNDLVDLLPACVIDKKIEDVPAIINKAPHEYLELWYCRNSKRILPVIKAILKARLKYGE